ncbi:hypothetical protein RRG08_038825 [Elysia crispata]|uniref:Uncharacterized protein n=1 Tax=Elysia crispata TaxID=231223 RepID=A0AAE0YSL3_9GAST|nr:hypothetical protein RRG08_038825 [Elysia crispata]
MRPSLRGEKRGRREKSREKKQAVDWISAYTLAIFSIATDVASNFGEEGKGGVSIATNVHILHILMSSLMIEDSYRQINVESSCPAKLSSPGRFLIKVTSLKLAAENTTEQLNKADES